MTTEHTGRIARLIQGEDYDTLYIPNGATIMEEQKIASNDVGNVEDVLSETASAPSAPAVGAQGETWTIRCDGRQDLVNVMVVIVNSDNNTCLLTILDANAMPNQKWYRMDHVEWLNKHE
jgi:hypothetical protein